MPIFLGTLLAALTSWLLLTASAKFLSLDPSWWRILLAACIGALFTAAAMVPLFTFAVTIWWRLLMLLLVSWAAFGLRRILPLLLFSLLHLSLSGMATAQGSILSSVLGSLGICLACIAVGGRGQTVKVLIPMESETLSLTALRDTGNTLSDPITGRSVLVVDAETANRLTGLTPHQLRDPLVTIGIYPGLRLIPYRTIDSGGFLLAKPLEDVTIAGRKGSVLVAFSPQKLGNHYEALTGGNLW